jgi:hypothetical protein
MLSELKLTSGEKVKFIGLSKNKGVVWVECNGYWKTHILIEDLDSESKGKIFELTESLKRDNC